ncbi:MAG: hypothetical protein IT304_10480 [Dehalococcoidia bacterium]|nr:hypothetical protein [Dehalococcoidia bacterium]
MVTAPDAETTVRFEGYGSGDEIWGATQANFVLVRPGQNARETAVFLNDPAAAHLADLLGEQDTEEFRARAARHVGAGWLERLIQGGRRVDAVIVLSRALLERDPAFVAEVKRPRLWQE